MSGTLRGAVSGQLSLLELLEHTSERTDPSHSDAATDTGTERSVVEGELGEWERALLRFAAEHHWSGRYAERVLAQPGDLLFWASDPNAPDDVDHVAIYLGAGKFVSAPHTGDVVHIGPFYGQGFRGVVRVDPANSSRLGPSS